MYLRIEPQAITEKYQRQAFDRVLNEYFFPPDSGGHPPVFFSSIASFGNCQISSPSGAHGPTSKLQARVSFDHANDKYSLRGSAQIVLAVV